MNENLSLLFSGLQIKRFYESMFKDLIRAQHLTQNEVDVLLFLANNPEYDTARDVVEVRKLSKSHVCKSVDLLEKRGWLSGEQDSRDHRCIHLKICPAARPVVAEAQGIQETFLQRLYEGVSPEEYKAMIAVLRKTAENIRRNTEKK